MDYIRLCSGLNDKGKLIRDDDNIYNYMREDIDYYRSLYLYNDEQYEQFKKSGSISGIENVRTKRLVFDFDSEDSIKNAAEDSKKLCDKLISFGINAPNIQISFSGGKGFHVELDIDKYLTPDEFRNIVHSLGSDLPTFDDKIWNASRIIRISHTKHQKTGLYKTPIKYEDLRDFKEEAVLSLAKTKQKGKGEIKVTHLPDKVYKLKDVGKLPVLTINKVIPTSSTIIDVDLVNKPNWMSNCMFALSQGFFNKGERHDALHKLAVMYQQQGFPKNVVLKMLQGIADLQSERTGDNRREDYKLSSEDMGSVFGNWRGGVYSCKTDFWLKSYCTKLGHNSCKHRTDGIEILDIDQMTDRFEDFAKNIDKFIIKSGIPRLDKKLKLMVGNVLGVLAAPSAGKSAFVVTLLNNMSKDGVDSLFMSYDMFEKLLFQRLAQKHFNYNMDDLYDIYKKDNFDMQKKIKKLIKEEYSHVGFCYQSGQTVDEIEKAIYKRENETGRKVKMVAVDYLELVDGEANDPTQSSLNVATALKNMAIKLEVLVVLILQPQKVASKPDEPIKSFTNAKGSGMIGQAVSYFLGCHRDGLNPDYPGNDKYFTIRCLKNRTGELFTLDFSWDGVTGSIRELTKVEEIELENFKKQKEEDGKEKKASKYDDFI